MVEFFELSLYGENDLRFLIYARDCNVGFIYHKFLAQATNFVSGRKT